MNRKFSKGDSLESMNRAKINYRQRPGRRPLPKRSPLFSTHFDLYTLRFLYTHRQRDSLDGLTLSVRLCGGQVKRTNENYV